MKGNILFAAVILLVLTAIVGTFVFTMQAGAIRYEQGWSALPGAWQFWAALICVVIDGAVLVFLQVNSITPLTTFWFVLILVVVVLFLYADMQALARGLLERFI
ncbi:MAG: hypothetical protein IJ493_13290 [Clostridia bacterium]|nr:hypothetical protein [Clostridia bacterium]